MEDGQTQRLMQDQEPESDGLNSYLLGHLLDLSPDTFASLSFSFLTRG